MSKLLRLVCCLALFGLAACGRIEPPETSGKLVVAIRETPAFFEEHEGAAARGFEHDLVTAFADSLGLEVQFIKAADPAELNDLALSGRVHLAASMPLGNASLEFSTPVRSVRQWIVGHDDALGPERLADLAGRTVEVVAGSALADTLRGLDEKSRPQVVEVPGVTEMELLERVVERKAELVAVHEIHLDLGVNFHPELNPRVQLPGRLELGWAFGGKDAGALRDKADAFIAGVRADGTLARLHDRYFGHIKRIDAAGIARFFDDIRTRLPAWRPHFQSAQNLTGIDWRLLAALAYQESHWDPLGHLAHQRARHDDADRGHGRLPACQEPPRRAGEHPRRRPLPGGTGGADSGRATAGPPLAGPVGLQPGHGPLPRRARHREKDEA